MTDTNRQTFPSGLWVVATPIGNLGDMTPRAQEALARADFILCEDTRRTLHLLSALGLKISGTHLERLDAHTPVAKMHRWMDELDRGKKIALVTDAGTPTMSDPGSQLVALARSHGHRVVPFPGASAITSLLSVAGFHQTEFIFRGFFPRKSEDRVREIKLAQARVDARITVWFESPKRILSVLQTFSEQGPETLLVVGKELTKLHEKFFSGVASLVFSEVGAELEREGELGEWCFAAYFSSVEDSEPKYSDSNSPWNLALLCLLDAEVPASQASKIVSHRFGVPKKLVYEAALKLSGKKNHE